jgi:hypothetical protein
MKIYGYYHICAINNYYDIVKDQLQSIYHSGLINHTEKLFISILIKDPDTNDGSIPNKLFELFNQYLTYEYNEKTEIKYIIRMIGKNDIYELETINMILEDAKNNNSNENYLIYYLHSKGVSNKNIADPRLMVAIRDWRLLMEEVIIWNWEACEKILSSNNDYDVCGINYISRLANDQDFVRDHFHGNFWWATSNYVSSLKPLSLNSNYVVAEMWLSGGNPNVYEFFSTRLNHYTQSYHPIPDLTFYGLPKSRCPGPKLKNDLPIYPGKIVNKYDPEYLKLYYINTNIYSLSIEIENTKKNRNYELANDKFYPIFKVVEANYKNVISKADEHRCRIISKFLLNLYVCLYYSNKERANEIVLFYMKMVNKYWNYRLIYLESKTMIDENFRYLINGDNYNVLYHPLSKNYQFVNIFINNRWELTIKIFGDIVHVLIIALQNSGIRCKLTDKVSLTRPNIILASENLRYPENSIILNMEQLDDSCENNLHNKMIYEYHQKILSNSNYHFIDYDPNNINILKNKYQISDIGTLKFGYVSEYELITSYDESIKDIDVLFLGGENSYRNQIKDKLNKTSYKIHFENHVFDQKRIDLMRRAKIILNIRGYGNLFQISRIGYLLNNHSFIICEDTGNKNYYEHLLPGMIYVPYDQILKKIDEYLPSAEKRKTIADIGYHLYLNTSPTIQLPKLT